MSVYIYKNMSVYIYKNMSKLPAAVQFPLIQSPWFLNNQIKV